MLKPLDVIVLLVVIVYNACCSHSIGILTCCFGKRKRRRSMDLTADLNTIHVAEKGAQTTITRIINISNSSTINRLHASSSNFMIHQKQIIQNRTVNIHKNDSNVTTERHMLTDKTKTNFNSTQGCRSCIKHRNNNIDPIRNKTVNFQIDDEDAKRHTKPLNQLKLQRQNKFNYSVFEFDALQLTDNMTLRTQMVIDLFIMDGLQLLEIIQNGLNDLVPFVLRIKHINKEFVRAKRACQAIAHFYKHSQSPEMCENSLNKSILVIFDFFSILNKIQDVEFEINNIAYLSETDNETMSKLQHDEKRLFNRHIRKSKFNADKVSEKLLRLFIQTYGNLRQFQLQKAEMDTIKHYVFGAIMLLKNNLQSLSQTYVECKPIFMPLPAAPGGGGAAMSSMIKSIFPEMADLNVFTSYYYPQLMNVSLYSELIPFLSRNYIMKIIHGCVWDPRLFRIKVEFEHIVKYTESKGEWYVAKRFTYSTNNPASTWLKWKNLNNKTRADYSDLIPSDLIPSTSSQITAWTEHFSLVTAVLMAEFNGVFGVENLYRGDGRIKNVTEFTTKLYFEIPVKHSFSDIELQNIQNTTRITYF